MTVRKIVLALSVAMVAASVPAYEPRTYCNPLNIDYSLKGDYRHAADPVIVPFEGRYYLFTTWDRPGYRVSTNLVDWAPVDFDEATRKVACEGPRGYCAPAAAAHGGWMYFIPYVTGKSNQTAPVLRTKDPMSGRWEPCGEIRRVSDPALFVDDDGRFYVYHGLGEGVPTQVFEVDPKTFREVPGTARELRPRIRTVDELDGGWERARNEMYDETDASAFLGTFKILPCQEGAWMTKYKGHYYLQYASPGTVSIWYGDAVMEGVSPAGPFRATPYSPVSAKPGGFIGSAGHSCVFQDFQSNWWRVTTMWIGVHHRFERRIGLFPVEFDSDGRMRTFTTLGDYPLWRPTGTRGPADPIFAGLRLLSYGKKVSVSSSLGGRGPELAVDENVRTWWSAATNGTNEWLRMDLGRICAVRAVQVNFAEQNAREPGPDEPDAHRYRLLGSPDGEHWMTIADRSGNDRAVPHDYIESPRPIRCRYVVVENVSMPGGGLFAIRDLRVFGRSDRQPPGAVKALEVRRHDDDKRNATLSWSAAEGADGYLVRYGFSPEHLWQTIQVQGGGITNLVTHALDRGVDYWFRVDAFNESGDGFSPVKSAPSAAKSSK